MNIKRKTLVLSTVGAFALSYAIVGSSAFADTDAAPVPSVPSATAPITPTATPLVSPIQAPAGLTPPSTGITQNGEDDDFDDLSDDADEVGEYDDDEISGDDSDDQLTMSITVGNINQSRDTEDDMGEDD